MTGHTEAARKLRMNAKIASLEFKDFATAITAEMMMMRFARNFISQGFAWH
jgi:hypothetical protein